MEQKYSRRVRHNEQSGVEPLHIDDWLEEAFTSDLTTTHYKPAQSAEPDSKFHHYIIKYMQISLYLLVNWSVAVIIIEVQELLISILPANIQCAVAPLPALHFVLSNSLSASQYDPHKANPCHIG